MKDSFEFIFSGFSAFNPERIMVLDEKKPKDVVNT